jgi:hypothetical protein
MPPIWSELDRREDDPDVERLERLCEQHLRSVQDDFRALTPGLAEHLFVCIEHLVG